MCCELPCGLGGGVCGRAGSSHTLDLNRAVAWLMKHTCLSSLCTGCSVHSLLRAVLVACCSLHTISVLSYGIPYENSGIL